MNNGFIILKGCFSGNKGEFSLEIGEKRNNLNNPGWYLFRLIDQQEEEGRESTWRQTRRRRHSAMKKQQDSKDEETQKHIARKEKREQRHSKGRGRE